VNALKKAPSRAQRNKKYLCAAAAASLRKAIKIDVRRAMNFNQAERVPAAAYHI